MTELQVQAVYAKPVNLLEVLPNDLICLAYANGLTLDDEIPMVVPGTPLFPLELASLLKCRQRQPDPIQSVAG